MFYSSHHLELEARAVRETREREIEQDRLVQAALAGKEKRAPFYLRAFARFLARPKNLPGGSSIPKAGEYLGESAGLVNG